MRSAPRGKRTSAVEVTNVSAHGFWILIQERELFVAFEYFPWFRQAPVAHILEVQMLGPNHLYWPALDVDLAAESIEKPESFPLVSRAQPKALQPASLARGRSTKRRPSRAARS